MRVKFFEDILLVKMKSLPPFPVGGMRLALNVTTLHYIDLVRRILFLSWQEELIIVPISYWAAHISAVTYDAVLSTIDSLEKARDQYPLNASNAHFAWSESLIRKRFSQEWLLNNSGVFISRARQVNVWFSQTAKIAFDDHYNTIKLNTSIYPHMHKIIKDNSWYVDSKLQIFFAHCVDTYTAKNPETPFIFTIARWGRWFSKDFQEYYRECLKEKREISKKHPWTKG
jgi:hypothetical protein